MPDGEELTELNPIMRAEREEGLGSIIYDYCKQLPEDAECIWICMRRGRRRIAKDLKLEESQLPIHIHGLRKIFGWWKQHSFYSAIAVKEAMMQFLTYDSRTKEIGVAIINFDYDGIQRELAEAIAANLENEIEPLECGVDIQGNDSCEGAPCPNLAHDGLNSTYCIVQRARQLSLRRDNYKFLPSMIEHYWQNGIDEKAIKFLRNGGFITQYKNLATNKYSDATNPYGKIVYAFMLVEGWHIRYMLLLTLLGILCSVCVVAVATAVSQSLEIGLTAKSYALSLTTVFLAIMTFLSAVL